MTSNKYFESIIAEFPSLSNEILEEDESHTYSRMECFAKYTNDQIKLNNELELNRCFSFQESKIDLMNSEFINVLKVSYCEALLLGEYAEKMKQIKKNLPSKLYKIYTEYENWYNELEERSKNK